MPENNSLRRALLVEEYRTLRIAIIKYRGDPVPEALFQDIDSLTTEDLVQWIDGLRDIARSVGGMRGRN